MDEMSVRFFVKTETEQMMSVAKVKIHEPVLESCNNKVLRSS